MSEETRSIVPRKDGEAGIGREDKYWGKGYFGTVKARDEIVYKDKVLSDVLAKNEKAITANAANIAKNTSNITANKESITAVSKEVTSLKASVGTPLVAATASAMTDKNKIYVYTGTEAGYTKGNWYYNNGSSWVSGGVYNSIAFETDQTLTVSNQAADAKSTGDYLRLLSNGMDKVKGNSFGTGGGMVTNNRIESKPIYLFKGTIIHLLKPNYYYAVNDGDWKLEDTVIDKTGDYIFSVCKAPIVSSDPSTAFDSVDEIEDIIGCFPPPNETGKAAITRLYKNMSKVKGASFATGGGMVTNNRIKSKPIYALKGTVIHLLSSKYYYDIGNEWIKEDTVIDENKIITILVCKEGINDTTPDMAFESVDEIEDIVVCLVPENEPKEDKELVRQATYSSENNYGENLSTPVFSLLHFSDLHADTDALNRIVKKSSEYPLDDMICTGDMVEDNASESIKDWWEPKILTCMGNHDVAVRTDHDGIISYDWSKLTMQERDTKYISPFISQWGSVTHESGTSYYFKDYPNKKVRLVVVDIMLYFKGIGTTSHETESAKQTQWLEETLQSAINLGYHVVIATHYPLLGARVKDCSFSPYDSDGILFDETAFTTILQDTVDKYIQKGLHFVCYLGGHQHKDAVVYVDKTTKQIQILITCAHTRVKGLWDWGDQYRGSDDDAMNIVCVDTYHNRLKLVRIGGANVDECMRPRKAICIDYSTGKICGEIK